MGSFGLSTWYVLFKQLAQYHEITEGPVERHVWYVCYTHLTSSTENVDGSFALLAGLKLSAADL